MEQSLRRRLIDGAVDSSSADEQLSYFDSGLPDEINPPGEIGLRVEIEAPTGAESPSCVFPQESPSSIRQASVTQGILPELQARDLPSKRLLGKGLASIVYETELNGMRFARKDFAGVPVGIFKYEAAKLVDLKDHQNVVKAHALTIGKASCSLVLEHMDDDLLAVLQKRKRHKRRLARTDSSNQSEISPTPFELPEAFGYMLQIARGMEYLHGQGIFHGDLKTKNILVAYVKDGDKSSLLLKVADYGLVQTKRKSMSHVSRQARKLDMVRWKAPEELEMLLLEDKGETSSDSGSDEELIGSSSVTDRLLSADVFSFALTCFHILTGEEPYPNQNWKELATKIVFDELRPTLPAACPLLLRDLLVKFWREVPAERPNFTLIRRELESLESLHITEKAVDQSSSISTETFDVKESSVSSNPRNPPTRLQPTSDPQVGLSSVGSEAVFRRFRAITNTDRPGPEVASSSAGSEAKSRTIKSTNTNLPSFELPSAKIEVKLKLERPIDSELFRRLENDLNHHYNMQVLRTDRNCILTVTGCPPVNGFDEHTILAIVQRFVGGKATLLQASFIDEEIIVSTSSPAQTNDLMQTRNGDPIYRWQWS
ncbi:hypothetical protein KC19_12G066100 [Ceratodon purpureus]|uniref:Protein kinase domain-containing protein n=1 Tax=Ceratodon purpureus TaxID=3225 RepID=A0A8T0G519_CERPU|nr:hypothetical protein KC19_12G066100 [Ceratodon purpureus]